jgi:type I restriction enzyme R subunit
VQNRSELSLSASRGVAVREGRSLGGSSDYILFADGKAVGVVDAKRVGTTLSGVADEQGDYLEAWQHVDSKEGVPLAVARKAFGSDPKPVIEELNSVLVA